MIETAEAVKDFLHVIGASQEKLADKLYVSRSAVSKWLNGRGIPSERIESVSDAVRSLRREYLDDHPKDSESVNTALQAALNYLLAEILPDTVDCVSPPHHKTPVDMLNDLVACLDERGRRQVLLYASHCVAPYHTLAEREHESSLIASTASKLEAANREKPSGWNLLAARDLTEEEFSYLKGSSQLPQA